jgi:phosphatidyl-myo-inositol alpha-mannosyltransferase
MKIGLVCPYNIFRGGGVQECVFAMQKELQARGHQVKIITPQPREIPTDIPGNIILLGDATEVKSFHTTSQISASVNTEMVNQMLEDEQFDILHFHEPWVPILSRQILARSTSINIATFHAKLPDTVMHRTIEKVITPYTRSILKNLHSFTAVSDAAAEYLRSLTKRPIELIPNGIDLSKYKFTNHAVLSDKPTILYIGRLEKRKGLSYLLQAMQLLQQKYPDVRLQLAGSGPDQDKLLQEIKDFGLHNVEFLGYVSDEEKLRLLQEADLFCSPARYGESFGIVLLEAMASGLPIVAGDNPGYTAVMQGRGKLSLVNPKDVAEFANRLELLLFDKDIRRLWSTWAKEYVTQFDYVNVVDQYEALYKSMRNHL